MIWGLGFRGVEGLPSGSLTVVVLTRFSGISSFWVRGSQTRSGRLCSGISRLSLAFASTSST